MVSVRFEPNSGRTYSWCERRQDNLTEILVGYSLCKQTPRARVGGRWHSSWLKPSDAGRTERKKTNRSAKKLLMLIKQQWHQQTMEGVAAVWHGRTKFDAFRCPGRLTGGADLCRTRFIPDWKIGDWQCEQKPNVKEDLHRTLVSLCSGLKWGLSGVNGL